MTASRPLGLSREADDLADPAACLIVAHGGLAMLEECLGLLGQHDVVIVDNGTDGQLGDLASPR